MRGRKNGFRIGLPLVIVLVAAASLLPASGTAIPLDDPPIGDWVMTPEAAARTAAGDCEEEYGANGVCLEWCLSNDRRFWGTGFFDCFPG